VHALTDMTPKSDVMTDSGAPEFPLNPDKLK
jgi:hypothetical protein